MPNPIEFYFDFSSPYGYIASEKIGALAAKRGREVTWRPFLLGVAFKTTGGAPLPTIPLKGAYHVRDMARTARYHGVPYRFPSVFPIASVSPCRAFYWLDAKDPERAQSLAKALYRAYFVDDVDISSADKTVEVSAKFGLKADEVRAGIGDQAVKDRTRAEVDKAIARGAFGSPYIIVDGEPFWGSDRLDQIDKWLATGGW
ncbi:MAG TPA: 2-hydroxychromene-2-carboxylate isomerase [Burkholderiales bacterium]|nr:2-hydroxychromene-2-carboxylate isomerase [Burkholderiales bacterium]